MALLPPKRKMVNYEKVALGEMIGGQIAEIEHEKERVFKGFQGKEDVKCEAIRFKFKLDGYQYPHYSRWMKFTLGEKSNLYNKYVSRLVENAKPDMTFDLEELALMRVRTIWSENKDFQNIDAIYPEGKKIVVQEIAHLEDVEEDITSQETPF